MKNKIWGITFIICFSCNSSYKYLSSYYNENLSLHQQMSSDLKKIFDQSKSPMLIKKNSALNKLIFMYLPENNDTYQAIYFDSLLTIDKNLSPTNQLNFEIPSRLLQNMWNSVYHATKTDTTGVFFAYKYKNETSEFEIGLFTPFDSTQIDKTNIIRKLPNNFFIYKAIVP